MIDSVSQGIVAGTAFHDLQVKLVTAQRAIAAAQAMLNEFRGAAQLQGVENSLNRAAVDIADAAGEIGKNKRLMIEAYIGGHS